MPYEQGGLPLGVLDAKVGLYDVVAQTWGAVSDIMSVEMSRATAQLVAALARGDNRITGAAGVLEGCELVLRATGVNLSTMALMTGKSVTTISSVNQLQGVGGDLMPYFGIAIKADSVGGGDLWVWFPQGIIVSNYTFFQGEYNTFTSPELTIQCITEENWGLYNIITHPTRVPITVFPPADIAQVA